MTDKVLHQSETISTTGDDKPPFTPEQIEEHKITPEELASAGYTEDIVEPPGKILGKFDNQDDLEKAYLELEKKYHGPSPNKTEALGDTPTSEAGDSDSEESGEEQDVRPDDNTAAVREAFASMQGGGEITEEVYSKFGEAGIPKQLVDHVAELEAFKANAESRDIQEGVGGQENYGQMLDWAAKNLSQGDQDIFDNIIDKGTVSEVRFAVDNLHGRMNNATQPKKSNLIKADSITTAARGYSTQEHMLADVQDPRYNSDPSFRDEVMAKVGKSSW